jgi:hypothetical protein
MWVKWTGFQPSHYPRPLTQRNMASPPSLNSLSFPDQEWVDIYLHSPIFTHGAVLKQIAWRCVHSDP